MREKRRTADVYVRITVPDDYRDVHPDLVIEDAIPHTAFEIENATSEVATLREALEPFAAYGRCVAPLVYDDAPLGNNIKPYLTFGDVRRAAAALSRPALTGNGGKP